MTSDDYKRLADELDAATAKVNLFPERRCGGLPDGDLGRVFMDFLVVRNLANEAAKVLRAASVKAGEVVGEPVAWLRCAVEGDAPKPCNEDDDGAFPVYRAATPAPTASVGAMREALEVLALFRAFVQRNVTRWELGAGDHHHPMWALIAETLGDLNRKEFNNGEGWKFIQPRNREALAAANQSDGGLVPATGPVQPGDVLRYEVDEETRVGKVIAHLRPSDTPPAPQAVEVTGWRSPPAGIFADPRDGIMFRFEDNRSRKITSKERAFIIAALRGELPDDIRVPLHELQADVDYLIGRVVADGSCAAIIAASIKEKLAHIESVLLAKFKMEGR